MNAALFSYFEMSAPRSAFRGDCACAHCVHCSIKPAGQLAISAYVHIAGPLPPSLQYTSVEKLFRVGSIHFTCSHSTQRVQQIKRNERAPRKATWLAMFACATISSAVSLVPRPFFVGEEKTAWYTLLAHAHNIP